MRDPERFDPRRAALHHAAQAERAAERADESQVQAELAHSIACGLVYVGDAVMRLIGLQAIQAAPADKAQAIADALNDELERVA